MYLIRNTATKDDYLGSTADLKRRLAAHYRALKVGKHYNSYLQRAWDKYGAEAFSFEVLEMPGDNSTLLEREQFWYRVLSPTYNAFLPVRGMPHGYKRPPEDVEKIRAGLRRSVCRRGHSISGENELVVFHTDGPPTHECRVCLRASQRANYQKHRENILARRKAKREALAKS